MMDGLLVLVSIILVVLSLYIMKYIEKRRMKYKDLEDRTKMIKFNLKDPRYLTACAHTEFDGRVRLDLTLRNREGIEYYMTQDGGRSWFYAQPKKAVDEETRKWLQSLFLQTLDKRSEIIDKAI